MVTFSPPSRVHSAETLSSQALMPPPSGARPVFLLFTYFSIELKLNFLDLYFKTKIPAFAGMTIIESAPLNISNFYFLYSPRVYLLPATIYLLLIPFLPPYNAKSARNPRKIEIPVYEPVWRIFSEANIVIAPTSERVNP